MNATERAWAPGWSGKGTAARPLTAHRSLSAARLLTGVLGASITLVRLASTYPHKTLTIPLVTLLFLGCAAWGIPRQSRRVLLTGSSLLVFLYASDICVALLRGAQDGAYESLTSAAGKAGLYFSIIALGMVAIASARDRRERDERLLAIVLAPVAYAVINLLMARAGFQAPASNGGTAGTQAQLLGLLGASGGREAYPLATSINLYSIIAASAIAGLVVLRLRAPQYLPRMIAWPAILICLYEVVSGDSRATLLWAFAIVMLFVLRRRFAGAPLLAFAIPFFPLIVIGALRVVSSSGIASVFNRSGRGGQTNFGSLATGTGRVYIWRGTWQVLQHFRLQDLIGWGAAGQIPSGASTHYAFVFPNDPLAYTAFTHNAALQTIVDEGYIGLAILVAVIWRTFVLLRRHIRREPGSPAVALVAMLMVIVLSGATEVSPSYYAEEVLLMVFLIAGAAAALAAAPFRSEQSDGQRGASSAAGALYGPDDLRRHPGDE